MSLTLNMKVDDDFYVDDDHYYVDRIFEDGSAEIVQVDSEEFLVGTLRVEKGKYETLCVGVKVMLGNDSTKHTLDVRFDAPHQKVILRGSLYRTRGK